MTPGGTGALLRVCPRNEFLPLELLPLLVVPRDGRGPVCTVGDERDAALAAIEIPAAIVLGTNLLPYGGGIEPPPLGNVLEAFPMNPGRCGNADLVPPVTFMCSSA